MNGQHCERQPKQQFYLWLRQFQVKRGKLSGKNYVLRGKLSQDTTSYNTRITEVLSMFHSVYADGRQPHQEARRLIHSDVSLEDFYYDFSCAYQKVFISWQTFIICQSDDSSDMWVSQLRRWITMATPTTSLSYFCFIAHLFPGTVTVTLLLSIENHHMFPQRKTQHMIIRECDHIRNGMFQTCQIGFWSCTCPTHEPTCELYT